ncbi:MAG: UvrB/UvrC motif-containing protein [Candidatus Sumerlaeia bacterium]
MRCNKNPAVIKITKINKGAYLELALCQECAARESTYQKKMMQQQNLQSLLANLLKSKLEQAESSEEAAAPVEHLTCKACGYTLEQFSESFLLGCPECYTAFGEHLKKVLLKIHGSVSHVGKHPPGFKAAGGTAVAVADDAPPAQSSDAGGAAQTNEARLLESAPGEQTPALSPEEQLAEYHQMLKEATDAEDFLLAAQLRDKIRELEKKLK